MNNGLMVIMAIFVVIHAGVLIGFFINKHKLKKIALLAVDMVFELAFELGKALLVAGVVGTYFIPDAKDFSKAIVSGIIFFILGYVVKNRKDQ